MEKKKKSVKDRIVSAAWELFYEKGYDSTTVDDIIRLSDTSKGSFYYYFDGKDALLNTLSSVLDDLYLTLKEEMDPYMDSFEKLMFLNYRSHTFMEKTIKVDLLASFTTRYASEVGFDFVVLFPSETASKHSPIFFFSFSLHQINSIYHFT